MCVEKLARVVEVGQEGLSADAIVDGRIHEVLLMTLDPVDGEVRPGDWLLVHTGVALERLTDDEARRRLEYMDLVRAAGDSNG